MSIFNKQTKQQPVKKYWMLIFVLILALAGCNLPQPIPPELPKSPQEKTAAAGILHPEGLDATPTPLPTHETLAIPDLPEPSVSYSDDLILYTTQQGDTLTALAKRFDVPASEIYAPMTLPAEGLLPIGIRIQIPNVLEDILPYHAPILPDSEVVYGPTVGNFDAVEYAREAGGFLVNYSEIINGTLYTGPEIVQLVAIETSTNPRLLLAFLEYRSGWVFSHPPDAAGDLYPIGYGAGADSGLYKELMITAKLLAQGYYGWRDGSRVDLAFYNGGGGRFSPGLNAGSTGLMTLFAALYDQTGWEARLFGEFSFPNFYQEMFGDYWARAAAIEPTILNTHQQPELTLPFLPGEAWSLTGGPHITWQTGTPRGALDFAPITGEPPCAVSLRWATAAAPGLVVRSSRGVVALDLDGDGDEGTGWVLIYQHMAEKERAAVGTWLNQDSPVGHPSCEGGQASGTHLHFARKFNGEWLGVGEPFPILLSGWQAFAGEGRYDGFLQRGAEIVVFRPDGSSGSTIIRDQ